VRQQEQVQQQVQMPHLLLLQLPQVAVWAHQQQQRRLQQGLVQQRQVYSSRPSPHGRPR
jgi:hypothetical protein